jgi:L-threonylcarbamoyladenylate synthase
MNIVKVNKDNINLIIKETLNSLKNGSIIAYATETFYGLGVKFDLDESIKRLYKLKGRPLDKPIPLIIGDLEQLYLVAENINEKALRLIKEFWPGPLTLIFKAKKNVSNYITCGTNKVAVRIPGDSFALQLAKNANFPITATSANPSGFKPANDALAVKEYFQDNIDLIIDSGPTYGKKASTILDVSGLEFKILREGEIEKEKLLCYL